MGKHRKNEEPDVNENAHRLVQEATDRLSKRADEAKEKNAAAVALGKLGGSKGGLARAKNLSAKKRKAIAQKAAKARWNKKRKV